MTVTILLATRNGAAHLQAQLDSLLAQTHRDWHLWASDDGSTDATPAILTAFGQAHPQYALRLLAGPCRGSAANFLSLLCHPDLPPGPVAFCDQDDVWLKGKLARALRRLAVYPEDQPALYAAESWRTDADLRRKGRTTARGASPGFANALVQNLCSGHTTVLNAAAVALARRAGAPPGIAFHDWWLYQLVTGAGGTCLLDPAPVALYRQHGANLMGATGTPAAVTQRARYMLRRDYQGWLRAHHHALQETGLMTPASGAILSRLIASEDRLGVTRACTFFQHGLRRSATLGTLALWCGVAVGRA